MLMIEVGYPTEEEEISIVNLTTGATTPEISSVLTKEEILQAQDLVRHMPVAKNVVEYAVSLVRKTRPDSSSAPQNIRDYVSFGAGPRASQNLILAGKANALLNGRTSVERSDIRSLVIPVLRHRLVTNFKASASGITTRMLLEDLLNAESDA